MDDLTVQLLPRANGSALAVRHRPGRGPTLVFLPGYMSDMLGSKAQALDGWAAREGCAMLRFDYSGCGESGGAFADGTIDIWRDDTLAVIDRFAPGPLVLVGSSMGGWLALLVARQLGHRIAGLIGIAAAPDFTEWGFSGEEKQLIQRFGRLERPSQYGPEPMVTTASFFNSGQHNRLLSDEIAIGCPVRLIHGQRDEDVPWRISVEIADRLRSGDVQTLLVKDGDHRLSRDTDIALILRVVADLLETI